MTPGSESYLFGGLTLVAGLASLLLPYESNPFRLERGIARHVSDEVNRRIPKYVGAFLVVIGLGIILLSLAM